MKPMDVSIPNPQDMFEVTVSKNPTLKPQVGTTYLATICVPVPDSDKRVLLPNPPTLENSSKEFRCIHASIVDYAATVASLLEKFDHATIEFARITDQLNTLSKGLINKYFRKNERQECHRKLNGLQEEISTLKFQLEHLEKADMAFRIDDYLYKTLYHQLVNAFAGIAASHGKWLLMAVPDKMLRDAETLVDLLTSRNTFQISTNGLSLFPGLRKLATIETPHFSISFHPACLIWHRTSDKQFAIVAYEDVCIFEEGSAFADMDFQPADGQLVDVTYPFARADGEADRRYKNNTLIPVYRYSRLKLLTKTGLGAEFVISNCDASQRLASVLSEYCRSHRVQSVIPKGDETSLKTSDSPPKAGLFEFQYLSIPPSEVPPMNVWYRHQDANNPNYYNFSRKWTRPWRMLTNTAVQVAGISFNNRAIELFQVINLPNFQLTLEKEPSNPHSKFAIKIMASGLGKNGIVKKHIGYLPDELSTDAYDLPLQVKPRSIYLPLKPGEKLGMKVDVLVFGN
jgi:hypothetical protein